MGSEGLLYAVLRSTGLPYLSQELQWPRLILPPQQHRFLHTESPAVSMASEVEVWVFLLDIAKGLKITAYKCSNQYKIKSVTQRQNKVEVLL